MTLYDAEKDRATVAEANTEFYAAFERGDLDAMEALWHTGPETLCVHPGAPPVRGTGAINRSWALIMANTPYIQFFLTDVEVSVLGDVASVTCTENVLTGDADVDQSSFSGGRAVATNVFVRTGDAWKLWIHHASPVMSAEHHED
jgi:ketosteroid isomerase-like protein